MRAHHMVLGWVFIVGPVAAAAQSTEVGERIRLRTIDGERVTATLVGITPSSIRIKDEEGERSVLRAHLTTVERSLGERRRFGRNLLITTAVGALAVGTMSLVMNDDTCNDQPLGCLDAGGAFIVGALVGGAISAPIGVVVGLSVRGEQWEPVTWPPDAPPARYSMPAARVVVALSLGVG